MQMENESIIIFLNNHGIKTEDGVPLDFVNHRFMLEIYRDMASLERDIAGLKAAQITFTTTAAISTLWIAKNRHVDIIYTLPTFDDIRIFAGGKVNRIIAQNPVFQDWVADKDTVDQKVVGDNIVHFRGTYSQKAATMVPSDLNIHDEVDSSNQKVIEQYSTRLQHSPLKRTWWFSHPSVPGNGVDKPWRLSDQKHWFVKCGACKKWDYLRWQESVCMQRQVYQCLHCQAEITDQMRRDGQWVRRYKDRSISGYWIPLLICPWVSAKQVIKYYETKSEEYFWNKVLGLPYVGGGNVVTQEQLYQNFKKGSPPSSKSQRVIIGVDTGVDCRYVIGTEKGIFKYGQFGLDAEERLIEMMKQWEQAILMIDQGGDILMARKLREKFPGRVYLVFYRTDHKTLQLVQWGDNDEYGRVQVDRNRVIQLLVDELIDRRFPIIYTGNINDWHDFWLHFSHIYRVAVENERINRTEYKWQRSDRDDWVHACVYFRCGLMRFGQKGAIIKAQDPQGRPDSYTVLEDGKLGAMPPPLKKMIEDAARLMNAETEEDWRKGYDG